MSSKNDILEKEENIIKTEDSQMTETTEKKKTKSKAKAKEKEKATTEETVADVSTEATTETIVEEKHKLDEKISVEDENEIVEISVDNLETEASLQDSEENSKNQAENEETKNPEELPAEEVLDETQDEVQNEAPVEETSETSENIKEKKSTDVLSIFTLLVVLFVALVVVGFTIFTIYNVLNTNIISGVHIKGVNVSNLSPSDAKYQLDNYLQDKLPEEIKLKHNDFETTISLSQMDITFDTKTATNSAFSIGRQGNIFENNLEVLSMMFSSVNIEPKVTVNKELLTKNLEDLSSQLPDSVVQSSYYIENNELIITSGKDGYVVDVPTTIESIKNSISTFSALNQPIELAVKSAKPDEINIEQIYNEVHKDPVDAYYTKDPFEIHPSENGIDFKVSLEEAKAMISSEEKEEYTIPLNILYPNVTTNMIGTEAFPDMLSTFSTKYAASNRNRTTNLILAANKINGTVIMPGETFSYNKVVGARTIAAGYKEAPIYVQGRVEDGLGGGICQITSTLYNAVIYANLEITQRTNHQFVPSYVTASRDATVVYGALDFQFKNNRNYPIKLVCSVSGGVATFQIFGMKQDDDYEVEISAYQTGRTSTAIYSEAYKILKRDGKVVDRQLLSKDTYKRH